MNRILVLALAIAAILAGVACGDDDGPDEGAATADAPSSTEITVAPGEPVRIGISTALTGPVAERGTEYRAAVILSIEQWKEAKGETLLGREVAVRSEDDGCTEADQTQVAAQRLINTPGLAGVIGPQCSAGAEAVIPTFAEAGVVAISGSATATALTTDQPPEGYFFRTAFRNDLQGNIVGDFVAETLRARSVLLVDNGETYGRDLATSTERFLAANGIAVARDTAPQGTVDFGAPVQRAVADAADAVGYAGFNPDAALFYRQLRDAGYEGTFGAFDAAASASEFVEPLGEIAEGVYFAGCALPLDDTFRSSFADLHGSEPAAAFNGQYADAVRVLLDAVSETATEAADGSLTIDRAALRDAVRATALEDGHTGAIRFDANGDRASDASEPAQQAEDFGLGGCQVRDSQLVQIQGP